jgi:hypothetical protein
VIADLAQLEQFAEFDGSYLALWPSQVSGEQYAAAV